MFIGIPRERHQGETRVAATPETVKKLTAAGHTITVEGSAGDAAFFIDEAFEAAGARIGSAADALGADMVLKVRAPLSDELPQMRQGAVLVGMLDPFNREGLTAIAERGRQKRARARLTDRTTPQRAGRSGMDDGSSRGRAGASTTPTCIE